MMRLRPLQPPGRLSRKARGYEADIAQLRAQGYTLDAIREALATEGVNVSLSTVWRETSRSSAGQVLTPADPVATLRAGPADVPPLPINLNVPETRPEAMAPALPSAGLTCDAEPRQAPLSGKDVAEAFRRSHGNPLVRAAFTHHAKDQS